MSDLYEELKAGAEGDWGMEAAVNLLAAHGRWLNTLDAHDYTQSVGEDEGCLLVDWQRVAAVLDQPGAPQSEDRRALLVGSGSERGVLRVACSLAVGLPVNLYSALSGLDDTNTRLVLHAIAHAGRGFSYAMRTVPVHHLLNGDPH